MVDDDQKPASLNDLLSPQARDRIHVASDEAKEKFEEKMQQIEIKEKERLTQDRALELGMGYINLKGFPIAGEVLGVIPEETARKLKAVCFFSTSTQFRIGSTDPSNPEVQELVEKLSKDLRAHGEMYMISEHSLEQALRLYATIPKPHKYVSGVEISEEDFSRFHDSLQSFAEINTRIQDVNISEVITLLIAGGIRNRSSDIHIEAEETDIKIRYRIDGYLHDVSTLPHEKWVKIVSRIKLLSGLKINVNDIPQDGRFTIHLARGPIDVRVSCIPTSYGESVVMRLLDSAAVGIKLEQLGLRGTALQKILEQVKRPNGMILSTGPTGSGKTTTLYAFLHILNTPDQKIITLENPVEYKVAGINQSEVETDKGYTFAEGLKSILRQDPDVVMVGEIRDPETAEIAVQAALTGHLMLSTMHTNNAAGTIPRLLSLKVVPYLLAPALNVVIGQRLVRRICADCKESIEIDTATKERIQKILSALPEGSGEHPDLQNLKFFRGKGCEKCNHIGYLGQIGIYEVLTMNPEIEKLVLSAQVSEYSMHDIAVKHGMVTMTQDGLLKALDGITTVEEVFKVTE